MDYSKAWKDICDGVWICTTTKYVNDPERVPATLKQLKALHIPEDMIHLNIMPHGSHATGHLSCTANHIEVMKQARTKNHRRILVVEDDIELYKTTDVKKSLEVVKNFVKTKKFDILYLGCFAHKMEKGIHRCEIRKASCYATHGYIMNIEFMEMIKHLKPDDIVDHSHFLLTKKKEGTIEKAWLTTPEHPSIDVWFILLSDSNLIAAYSIYPTLLYQKSLPSTISYKYTVEPFISTFGDIYVGIIGMGLFIIFVIVVTTGIAVYANKSRK